MFLAILGILDSNLKCSSTQANILTVHACLSPFLTALNEVLHQMPDNYSATTQYCGSSQFHHSSASTMHGVHPYWALYPLFPSTCPLVLSAISICHSCLQYSPFFLELCGLTAHLTWPPWLPGEVAENCLTWMINHNHILKMPRPKDNGMNPERSIPSQLRPQAALPIQQHLSPGTATSQETATSQGTAWKVIDYTWILQIMLGEKADHTSVPW